MTSSLCPPSKNWLIMWESLPNSHVQMVHQVSRNVNMQEGQEHAEGQCNASSLRLHLCSMAMMHNHMLIT